MEDESAPVEMEAPEVAVGASEQSSEPMEDEATIPPIEEEKMDVASQPSATVFEESINETELRSLMVGESELRDPKNNLCANLATVNHVSEYWEELGSEPDIFDLIVQELGVRGVVTQDIHSTVFDIAEQLDTDQVYGIIHCLDWGNVNVTRSRRSKRLLVLDDEDVEEDLYYSQQVGWRRRIRNGINTFFQTTLNSCGTHSILSILLNNPEIDIGKQMREYRQTVMPLNSTQRGDALGQTPFIAAAHIRQELPVETRSNRLEDRRQKAEMNSKALVTVSDQTFHFVSFMPIKGRLLEFDGLHGCGKPLDHGACGDNWVEAFRLKFLELNGVTGEYGNFSLLAVVRDPRLREMERMKAEVWGWFCLIYEVTEAFFQLRFLKINPDDELQLLIAKCEQEIAESRKMMRIPEPETESDNVPSTESTPDDLRRRLDSLSTLNQRQQKFQLNRVLNQWDYTPFIQSMASLVFSKLSPATIQQTLDLPKSFPRKVAAAKNRKTTAKDSKRKPKPSKKKKPTTNGAVSSNKTINKKSKDKKKDKSTKSIPNGAAKKKKQSGKPSRPTRKSKKSTSHASG